MCIIERCSICVSVQAIYGRETHESEMYSTVSRIGPYGTMQHLRGYDKLI
jgi:hypothetical protein